MKRALVVAAVLVLCACAFGERSLPSAGAVLHWSTVDLKPAAWCWNFGSRGECADSVGPEILLQSGDLKPIATAGGFDAMIEFKGQSALHRFDVELVHAPGTLSPVTPSATTTFPIPEVTQSGAGVYVYSITGRWPEGSVSYFLALRLLPGVA